MANPSATTDRTRPRSPSYPAIDLKAALDRARLLYKAEGKNSAPINTILDHWGYKPGSGAGIVAVAALKKFGLLLDEGSGQSRTARLSNEALRIILDDREPSPERDALIRAAALKPGVYAQLWAKYSDGLPSDATLKHELIFERGFTESGAVDFLAPFRSTVAFARLADAPAAGAQTADDDDEIDDEPLDYKSGSDGGHANDNGAIRQMGHREVQLPIAADDWATIRASFPLTEAKWKQMLAVLEAMRPALVLPDPDPAAGSAPDS